MRRAGEGAGGGGGGGGGGLHDSFDTVTAAATAIVASEARVQPPAVQELDDLSTYCSNGDSDIVETSALGKAFKMNDSGSDTFTSRLDFNDADVDDDLDPTMTEELDREVEDFARRLNSDWPERIQEILSFGPERKHLPVSIASNPSSQPCTGLDRR